MKQAVKRRRPGDALLRAARRALRDAADPAKAPFMQAYMKSEMPYLGVQAPEVKRVARIVFSAHRLESCAGWRNTVLELWRKARYREERYLAIELAGHRSYQAFRTMQALPMFEEMITSGAWWDYVDSIASHRLGELLRLYPAEMGAVLRKWARSDNLWKRRSAILAQLGFNADTDLKLLYDCIRPSLGEKDFFLRKAIGWALRQHAKTDAEEVQRYVAEHEDRLSPLSKREALKNMAKVTFTLDEATVRRIRDSAARLAKPQSAVVREAVRDFHDRIGKLSEQERVRLLRAFDELVPKIPQRSTAAVARELSELRRARRAGGRKTSER